MAVYLLGVEVGEYAGERPLHNNNNTKTTQIGAESNVMEVAELILTLNR